jgi:protein-disulfide isomerase
MSFIKTSILCLSLSIVILLAATSTRAELTKAEVEKIIESYLLNNGDKILKSVDDYQRKSMQDKADAAIKQNAEALFGDPRTPFIGNEKGDVTVVEFFDYNCGYCKHALPEIQALIESDKNVKVILKDLPILGPSSETAAKWALAAHKQGKYFAYHTKLMQNTGKISDDLLEKFAKDLGLDVAKMKADIEGTEILLQLEKDRSLASDLGIGGTPAFLIGNHLIPGAATLDVMKQKIAEIRAGKK